MLFCAFVCLLCLPLFLASNVSHPPATYWFQDTTTNPRYHDEMLASIALNCSSSVSRHQLFQISNHHTGIHLRMYQLDVFYFVAIDVDESLVGAFTKGRCNETLALTPATTTIDWTRSVDIVKTCVNHVAWRVWKSVEADFQASIESDLYKRNFVVTGHSLGGSIGAMVAAHLIRQRPKCVYALVTYGSPPIANAVLYRWMTQHTHIKLFVNQGDPIPRLMPPVYHQPRELELILLVDIAHAHNPTARKSHQLDTKQTLIVHHFTYFGMQRCVY